MNPKQIYSYSIIHTDDKNKLREQMIDLSEQGFVLDQLSTCAVPVTTTSPVVTQGFGMSGPPTAHAGLIFFTAVMKKTPEGPITDEGPDPTGGTPAAAKVIPFRQLKAVA